MRGVGWVCDVGMYPTSSNSLTRLKVLKCCVQIIDFLLIVVAHTLRLNKKRNSLCM